MSGFSQGSVLTQHNNISRTGWNDKEVILNTKNVNSHTFGALFSLPVDDQVYAQPLVVLNTNIPGQGIKNIVIVATVNNTVYAFDADTENGGIPYWQVNLNPAGSRAVVNTDMTGACGGNYKDFSGNMGIVGTPVIDSTTNTIYLVSKSVNTTTNEFSQYFHAMDITTGAEKPGSPVVITAQTAGTGGGSSNGIISFNSQIQLQRAGLLLVNGRVYITWASYCDWGPYHGWVIGYNKSTLAQEIVYNATPNGYMGGIWMSASGPSADELGNLYLATGNGSVGVSGDPTNLINRSESALKLTPSGNTLQVNSYFTPENYPHLDAYDKDFGVAGMLLLPNTNRVITGAKDGQIYVLDRNNMGGYSSIGNNVIQSISLGTNVWILRSSLSYYKGEQKEFVYSWSEKTFLHAFPVDKSVDTLDVVNAIVSDVHGPTGGNGTFTSVSSNGSVDSTAILWVNQAEVLSANQAVRHGIIRAFSAVDVTKELWNSAMNPLDDPGNYSKFNCPTISNGKVYIATFSNKLMVYGLKERDANDTCGEINIALNKPAVASTVAPGFDAINAVDGTQFTRWACWAIETNWIYIDLSARYDLCKVVLKWDIALSEDFQIQISEDATNWTTVKNIVGNTKYENYLPLQTTGRYVRMYSTKRGTPNGHNLWEFEVYGSKNPKQIVGDSNICPGSNPKFIANIAGTTYQWQVSTGSGFNDLFDDVNYSGAQNDSLLFTGTPTAWYGNQYRCLVDGIPTDTVTLKFSNTWTGAINTEWENVGNWSCNVLPDENTDVYINNGTVNVNSNPIIRSLQLKPGVNFNVKAGKIFTINK